MDYKAMLIKYMNWVGMNEGVDFIDEYMIGFTDVEKGEMIRLSESRRGTPAPRQSKSVDERKVLDSSDTVGGNGD